MDVGLTQRREKERGEWEGRGEEGGERWERE